MKLVFQYPDTSQLEIFLATKAYEDIWKQGEAKIKRVFKEYTGLEFQQDEIRVIVHNDATMPGTSVKPMRLSVKNATLAEKRIVLLAALSFRFLNGNGLLSQDVLTEADDHRVYLLLGEALSEMYDKETFDVWATLEPGVYPQDHIDSVKYFLQFSKEERRAKLRQLASGQTTTD